MVSHTPIGWGVLTNLSLPKAYSMERQMGTGNGWASSLDDQDVCQLLPLRSDQFEQGVSVTLLIVTSGVVLIICRSSSTLASVNGPTIKT